MIPLDRNIFVLIYITATIVIYACDSPFQDSNNTSISTLQSTKNQLVTEIPNEVVPHAKLANNFDKREACGHRNSWRNAYFGDLHIHTALSYLHIMYKS